MRADPGLVVVCRIVLFTRKSDYLNFTNPHEKGYTVKPLSDRKKILSLSLWASSIVLRWTLKTALFLTATKRPSFAVCPPIKHRLQKVPRSFNLRKRQQSTVKLTDVTDIIKASFAMWTGKCQVFEI